MTPKPWQIFFVLTIGMLGVSTAAIFVRLCNEAVAVKGVGFSVFIAASRLILAASLLVGNWPKILSAPITPQTYYLAAGAGVCLALHFATWITSLSFTSVAASTTLVTTNPIWVALLSWWWFKEKPTYVTMGGIGIALAGGILVAFDNQPVHNHTNNLLLGNCLALLGAWMASLYLILGSLAQKKGLTITRYITIAYSIAALVLLPLPWIFGASYFGYPSLVYLYILLMAIFAQLIGHSSINWATRWISPTWVTLAILFEPVGASFLAFILLSEVPPPQVIFGLLVLLIGVTLAVLGSSKPNGDQK